ncbi:MAG: pentapeptide repeat-containing protein [Actinobacteria bacterium]|nr:pentapeptide repeat-containing protein [Actinomycetota bacterium]
MRTRTFPLLIVLAVITAACTGTSTTSTVDPPVTTSPQTSSSLPEPTPVEAPPGVIWEAVQIDATGELVVSTIRPTLDGWIAAANRISSDRSAVPLVMTSPDGLTWTEHPLPSANARTYISDVIQAPAGYVAVGSAGTDCLEFCPTGFGVSWASSDGETWELSTPATFTGPVRVSPSRVELVGDRYMTVGKDERDGPNWAVGVWISPDGIGWERIATLDDPEWPLIHFRLTRSADGFLIDSVKGLCGSPFINADVGWTFGSWADQSVMWSSTDGVDWQPVDLETPGLVDPVPDDICDDFVAATDSDLISGTAREIGDILLWQQRDGGTWRLDGTSWIPTDLAWPDTLGAPRLVGTVDRLLAIEFDSSDVGVVQLSTAVSPDLVGWEDWSDYRIRLVDLLPAQGVMSSVHVAATEDAVVALIAADLPGVGRLGSYALASYAGSVTKPHCEPGPQALCASVDFSIATLTGLDLSGADFTGADLSSADLSGADLSGAILTGADLSGANLSGADLTAAGLSRATLEFADLTGTRLDRADLSFASLLFTTVSEGTTAAGAVLSEARDVPLVLVDDQGVVIVGASLQSGEGVPIDFSGLVLRGVDFDGDLSGSSFVNSDLTDSTFVFVTVQGADFTGAILGGVEFNTTDLTGAVFADADLGGVVWFGTTCPDGFKLEYYGGDETTCLDHLVGVAP